MHHGTRTLKLPYTKKKQKCKQSDGTSGLYVLSYTDKKGTKHRACHTSKEKMQGQVAAIETENDERIEEVFEEALLRMLVKETLYTRNIQHMTQS